MTRPADDEPDAAALNDLLAYWFGDLSDAVAADADPHLRLWWGKDAALDAEIGARFGALVERVAERFAAGLRPREPAIALATVIALDQLPRNIGRGTPAMYAHDPLALAACRHAASLADPLAGDLFRASFLFMPLMHSVTLADQDEMLVRFEAITGEAERRASPNLAYFENALVVARRHRDIVARFGRFPHRNAILGRPSSTEEEAFLREPDSAF